MSKYYVQIEHPFRVWTPRVEAGIHEIDFLGREYAHAASIIIREKEDGSWLCLKHRENPSEITRKLNEDSIQLLLTDPNPLIRYIGDKRVSKQNHI